MAAITATSKRIMVPNGKLVRFVLSASDADTFNPLDVASTTPAVGIQDWAWKASNSTECNISLADGNFTFTITSGTATGALFVWLAN